MKIKFKKQWYNETRKNKKGQDVIDYERKYMYKMTAEEDYFTEDKQVALKQAIEDLRNKANELEEIYKQNEKTMESWDSISK